MVRYGIGSQRCCCLFGPVEIKCLEVCLLFQSSWVGRQHWQRGTYHCVFIYLFTESNFNEDSQLTPCFLQYAVFSLVLCTVLYNQQSSIYQLYLPVLKDSSRSYRSHSSHIHIFIITFLTYTYWLAFIFIHLFMYFVNF